MSLQCPESPVYQTSAQQKAQSRNAAKVYRYGSPKIRDVLREKCRMRMREARQCNADQSRNTNGARNHAIKDILRQELAELEKDINLQEEIFKELLDEVNEWCAVQFEEEEAYLIDTAESDLLICPICQKDTLTELLTQTYTCKCSANFYFNGKMELRAALQNKIDKHEQNCLHTLTFFVEPQMFGQPNVLNAMCEKCDYFCSF